MLKKVLLAILAVIVAVIVVDSALVIYGTYKVVDNTLKEKEPQLRQYMQMDEVAQNKYIADNFAELLSGIDLDKDGKPEAKEELEKFKQVNASPEVQQALTAVGRSFLASAILFSDSLTKDMSADVKAKYQKEADEFEARADKYSKLLEANGIKME